MKRGFLTAFKASNGKEKVALEAVADKIGPDAVEGTQTKAPEPPRPAAPQRPRLVGVTSDSVTVQWTVCDTQGTAVSPDAAMQLEREPAGGQAEMSGKGAGEEHCHPWAGRTCIELNKDAGSSDSATAEAPSPPWTVDGTWNDVLFDGSGGYQATVLGLEPGCSYSIRARICDDHHGAIDSEAACLRTQASHPEQPDPPIVSGKGKNFLKLRWTAPRGRGAVVAQYEVEIRDACKQARAVQTCHSNDAEAWGCGVQVFQGEGTKCEIKGLRPGTSLQARVRAFNAVGASQASAWVNVSTTATVPSAPPQPFVSEARIGQLLFGWQESEEDGGLEVNSYCLEVDECRGDDGFMVKYNGPARQWLLSNTECGHPYKVRVKAVNAMGSSPFSEVLEVQGMCGPPTPPGAPELMELPPGRPTPGPAFSLCIRWAPPTEDNGSRVELYQVVMRRVIDGVAIEFFKVVYTGTETWTHVTGLFPASSYEFGLVAVSRLGTSAPSPTSVFMTSGAPPEPPPPPFLLGINGSDLHVGWTLPDVCNGSPVSSFVLECLIYDESAQDESSCSGQLGAWVSKILYTGGAISHWVCGFEPGAPVWLRVAGINAHGQGLFSLSARMDTPCALPGKVSNVHACATGPGKACVRWDPPVKDGGRPVLGYKIVVGRKGVGGSVPIQLQVEGPGPAHVDGLVAGSMYQAKVQAVNCVGAGDFSEPVVFLSEAGSPAAVPAPVVTETATDSIRLSWLTPLNDNGAPVEDFTLEMQATEAAAAPDVQGQMQGDSGAGAGAGNGKGGVAAGKQAWAVMYKGSFMSFQVCGLEPGANYRFRVRASNAAGDGPFSPAVQASTEAVPPGPPLAVRVLAVSTREAKLGWSAPAFDGGSVITSYAVVVMLGAEGDSEDRGRERAEREVWRGPATSCKFKVSPESVYTCKVYAYSVIGQGSSSIPLTFTTPAAAPLAAIKPRPPPALAAPTLRSNPGKTSNGQSVVVVTWTKVSDAQSYHVSVEPEESCPNARSAGDTSTPHVIPGTSTTTQLRDLLPGVTYSVRVRAGNEVGLGPWSPPAVYHPKPVSDKKPLRVGGGAQAPTATAEPPAPVKIVLDKATRTTMQISWESASRANNSSAPGARLSRRAAAAEHGRETYNVEIAEGSGGGWEPVGVGMVETRVVASRLKPGKTYRVRVQSRTEKRGESAWAEAVSFSTAPPNFVEVCLGNLAMLCFVFTLFFILFSPRAPRS